MSRMDFVGGPGSCKDSKLMWAGMSNSNFLRNSHFAMLNQKLSSEIRNPCQNMSKEVFLGGLDPF